MQAELAELAEITRAEIRRGYRNAGIGFAVGMALIGAVFAWRAVTPGQTPVQALVVGGAGISAMGAGYGMGISTRRIDRRKRSIIGEVSGTSRRIVGAVLRGKPDPLSEEEQQRAARYAVIASCSLPFETVQAVLLNGGFLLLLAGDTVWPPRGIDSANSLTIEYVMITLIAVLVVLMPIMMLRRHSRARHWTEMHAGI